MLQGFPNSVKWLKETFAGVFFTGDVNMMTSDKLFSKLKITIWKYWALIKIKIGMSFKCT